MAAVDQPESPEQRPPASEQPPPKRERLPVSPSLKPRFPEFKDYWKKLDDEWPGRVGAYVYRLFPRIIKPQGQPHYIGKLSEPLESEHEILQAYGTGEYDVRLYDSSFKQSNELCRCTIRFKVPYSERPPILDWSELDVGHPENRGYIEWRRSNNQPVPGDQNRNGQGNDAGTIAARAIAEIATKKHEPVETLESEAANTAFKLVAQASNHAIETVKAQSDPTALLKVVEAVKGSGNQNAEFFTTLLKVQADASANQTALITKLLDRPNGNNELVALIIKVQADANASQNAMTKSVFELLAAQKKSEAPAGMSGIRETVEAIASMADLFANGGGRRGNGGWVDALLNNPGVNRLAEGLGGAVINWSQAQLMRAQPAPQGAMQQNPAGRQPTPAADGTMHYPGEQIPAGQAPPSEEAQMQEFLIGFFMPRSASFINAIDKGWTGDDFAQRLYEIEELDPMGSGMTVGQHAAIKGIGKEKLVQFLGLAAMANPQLKQMLAGKQTLVYTFLDQFLSWEPEADVPPPPEVGEVD